MIKKKINKKINNNKETSDWFDSHVEVIGFGRGTANKKAKQIIKQQLIKSFKSLGGI
jgi:hypothetical protein